MSDIVLSSATRSSLLAAQNTASLLGTTQNHLATGKKVTSALDNPTNFFTAAGLDSRAGDLTTLLDGVSNGIQTIQAANTGITNIQKLVDSAKSTANQALATTLTTTGTATAAISPPAATAASSGGAQGAASSTALTFTINGTTITSAISGGAAAGTTPVAAAIPADSIDTVISNLNSAASAAGFSGTTFSKNTAGNRITINTTGTLSITDSATKTALGFTGSTDVTVNGLDTRKTLATQYNSLLTQIDQLAGDSGYNGVNLLGGTSTKLHLQFNEKNSSSLDVNGVDASSSGIGLSAVALTSSASFSQDSDINTTLTSLTNATSKLRGFASTLGSNLTVAQNRQDFSKHLINVLQTGSSNLVDADLNSEAANSQALSTRQSLAISALSLANTAQQNVLQLLR